VLKQRVVAIRQVGMSSSRSSKDTTTTSNTTITLGMDSKESVKESVRSAGR